METIALLSHRTPTAVIAYRAGRAISAGRFLSDARHLARSLPAGEHVLNVCADRYHFTVGLAACLLTGKTSLLPSTHTPEVIAQLASFAPDVFCLTDDARCDIGLPKVYYPELSRDELEWAVPALAAAHEPGAALAMWLDRYTEYLATKRGLATALHSGDPAYGALPGYFRQRLGPALGSLLEAAIASGEIRAGISATDLLHAVANLCLPVADEGAAYSQRMVALLIDGLRYGASTSQSRS